MSNSLYVHQRFLLMTLDPLHIGTGGYRLGRVDLSIVREPGTNLPKVPGTSLSGAIRQYAAMRYEKMGCAGQKGCGQAACPICYTFGSAKDSGGGYAGAVSLFDARLLLFPVHSLAGPVWVTSPAALADFGVNGQSVANDKARWPQSLTTQKHLNLGWLMLECESKDWSPPPIQNVPPEVQNRVVLVSDKLFSQIVNSNLEVRTSVSIDPHTGAAAEGALFTYEALPRATFLWFDVVEDDYRKGFPKNDIAQSPLDVVKSGLALAEYLGIGGMGTRGFGRVKHWEVNHAQS
ncbi:MAG: type III-B CRISPR module RAMP protein Cmr4 [Anaerolineales bacterium]|nr:type III-B CRISPR module RAMP protein Cmr4 [Anaerolineales bacterium]MDW8278972.1 type III-B CRISPR module RAMP protein Cmr4 [Anaerolineales bacterium]